jgi:hypothetical protein
MRDIPLPFLLAGAAAIAAYFWWPQIKDRLPNLGVSLPSVGSSSTARPRPIGDRHGRSGCPDDRRSPDDVDAGDSKSRYPRHSRDGVGRDDTWPPAGRDGGRGRWGEDRGGR